jgi:hypothetical protein
VEEVEVAGKDRNQIQEMRSSDSEMVLNCKASDGVTD